MVPTYIQIGRFSFTTKKLTTRKIKASSTQNEQGFFLNSCGVHHYACIYNYSTVPLQFLFVYVPDILITVNSYCNASDWISLNMNERAKCRKLTAVYFQFCWCWLRSVSKLWLGVCGALSWAPMTKCLRKGERVLRWSSGSFCPGLAVSTRREHTALRVSPFGRSSHSGSSTEMCNETEIKNVEI